MTRFNAIFAKSINLEETDIETSHCLAADNLDGAEQEALGLTRPAVANLIKILVDGQIVRRTWLPLEAA